MKVFCENCGREFEAGDSGATVCNECRRESQGEAQRENVAVKAVANLAGLDGVKGFSLSRLFSQAFRSHTPEEYSCFWSTGSVGNIPTIDKIDTSWPTPWMFVRCLLMLAAFCVILFLGWKLGHNNLKLLPGVMCVGTLLTPLTILLFFFEMNARKNVSLATTLKVFLLGGALSLLLAILLFPLANKLGLGWMGASVAGIVEETAKLLTVVIFVQGVAKTPYILNGLLFGAAVGAGFAAFESMGYAIDEFTAKVIYISVNRSSEIAADLQQYGISVDMPNYFSWFVHRISSISSGALFHNVWLRGVFVCLTGHILWTGMSAAALWMVRGGRPFEIRMLFDFRFLRIFIIAMASHAIWNCSALNFSLVSSYDKYILLGIVNWIVIFAIIAKGLAQLKAEKDRTVCEVETGVEEVIAKETIYVQAITTPAPLSPVQPAPQAPARHPAETFSMPDSNHLGIRQQVQGSAEQEKEREVPRYQNRAWQKYYKREK